MYIFAENKMRPKNYVRFFYHKKKQFNQRGANNKIKQYYYQHHINQNKKKIFQKKFVQKNSLLRVNVFIPKLKRQKLLLLPLSKLFKSQTRNKKLRFLIEKPFFRSKILKKKLISLLRRKYLSVSKIITELKEINKIKRKFHFSTILRNKKKPKVDNVDKKLQAIQKKISRRKNWKIRLKKLIIKLKKRPMEFQWFEMKQFKRLASSSLNEIQFKKRNETNIYRKKLHFYFHKWRKMVFFSGIAYKKRELKKIKRYIERKEKKIKRFSYKILFNAKKDNGIFRQAQRNEIKNKCRKNKNIKLLRIILKQEEKFQKLLTTFSIHGFIQKKVDKEQKKNKIKTNKRIRLYRRCRLFKNNIIFKKELIFKTKYNWRLLFFKKTFNNWDKLKAFANENTIPARTDKKSHYKYNKAVRRLVRIFVKNRLEIPYYLNTRKTKYFVKPKSWINPFSKRDYENTTIWMRLTNLFYRPSKTLWVFTKKCYVKTTWYRYTTTIFVPKIVAIIAKTWRPYCKTLFKLTKLQYKYANISPINVFYHKITEKKSIWKLENVLSTKKKLFKYKLYLSYSKLNKYNWKKLRRLHRLGHYKWNKKFYLYQFGAYMRWRCRIEPRRREMRNLYVPFKFQHTQKNPKRYYQLSRWANKNNKWLTPIAHLRKLSWYQLYTQITLEKRHPHRYKSYKVYKWFLRTMSNKTNYGFRAKKNYRLKQIMFGRIILPALDYLGKKEFLAIRKNVFKIKPLGLQHSRPAMFLGKFERRIDILTYKLNFAPTIQWARSFVVSGLIYVNYLTFTPSMNYKQIRSKKQKYPLRTIWLLNTTEVFDNKIGREIHKKMSFISRWQWNMPLPVTLPHYLVRVKAIVHWSSKNITEWFYKKFCNKYMPRYFIYNREQTVAYFWRNLRLSDIDRQRSASRIKWNTMKWLL